MQFKDRVAYVTGAGAGIGADIARALALIAVRPSRSSGAARNRCVRSNAGLKRAVAMFWS